MAEWNGLPPDIKWRGFHWLAWGEHELPVLWEPDLAVWSFGYLAYDPGGMARSGAHYLQPILRPSEQPKVVKLKR